MLQRFRNPEYTGPNRCMACTVANSVLAVLASLGAGVAVAAAVNPALALAVSVVVLVVSGLFIWLRGYLVPKTPTLTKRYIPQWMLAWFGKAPSRSSEPDEPVTDRLTGDEVESYLREWGVLTADPTGSELRLSEDFENQWQAALDVDTEIRPADVLSMLGFDPIEAELERYDDAIVVRQEGIKVGQWPSKAALKTDLAAETVLSEWVANWESLPPTKRGQLLYGVRLFVERCPDGDKTVLRSDTVESCCSTRKVATVTCEESGDRLLEQALANE